MKRMSGAARRQQILEAAHGVILEKGLAQAATRDVTRRLGVGSGLLHHYFKSWPALRAEVVDVFIRQEIDALRARLDAVPAAQRAEALVGWMLEDPAFAHWRLWLDAIEEARRDADLADVVHAGYIQWHAALRDTLAGAAAPGSPAHHAPDSAAWRVSVLIDGLVGLLVLDKTPLTRESVGTLLETQLAMELAPR